MIITDDFVVLNFPKTGSTFVRIAIRETYQNRMRERSVLQRILQRLGIRKRPFFQELMLPSLSRPYRPPNTHGKYQQVPPEHRHKCVLSVIRNPYHRIRSMYEWGDWKNYPHISKSARQREFPHFPNLSLAEFIRLREIELMERFPYIDTARVGIQTVQFIQMFFRDPEAALRRLDERYVDSGQFTADMPTIVFLRTESLNQDLHDFLRRQGFSAAEIGFLLQREKANATRKESSEDPSLLFTPDVLRYVREKERLLFHMYERFGATYPHPEVSHR